MYSKNVRPLCDKTLRIKELGITRAPSCINLNPPSALGILGQQSLRCQEQGTIPGRSKLFKLHESVTAE